MEPRHDRLKEILAEAVARSDPAARAAYLDEACAGDEALRAEVETLAKAYEEKGELVEKTLVDSERDAIGEGPGTVIGRYKLLQEIGEGGFGLVFMAEQLEPVQRKVALKIIKAGMDTREVIARFEAERQALALMDHPNIARVLDAGATESGRPYFVMELVKGIKITDYCDQNNLSTEERLDLFIKVCHAVQHAHQKGIIHRDLKPSNVMITLHDGEAVPKVIDFGIAKATGQRLTEKTLFTRYEQMIGTPAYMSPEQAQISGLDVDTRTDVYALGVLLYELLTGETPFDKETLAKVALDEIRRMIQETEPPKPSTRLTELARSQKAEVRGQKAEVRCKEVRGDLDWIVMKALEKDRRRRYATASDFAEDVERHLKHEPVVASPPSAVYRARKFVRRHRVGVAVGGAVTVALLAGLAVALLGLQRALRAEAATRQERDRAVAAEGKAQSEGAIAEAVNQFLQQDLLRQASPYEQGDRDVKLRTLLDRAAEKVGTRFQDKPLVEAEIRVTLSGIYRNLGEYTNARVHLDRALEIYKERLGPEDPRFLKARASEASLFQNLDRQEQSQALLEQLLPIQRRVLGPEHPDTLEVMGRLADTYRAQEYLVKAQQLAEACVSGSRRVLGAEHQDTLWAMLTLAGIYGDQGRKVEVQKLLKEVLVVSRQALGEEHPITLNAKHYVAIRCDLSEAQRQLEELVLVARRVLGPEHPTTLLLTVDLAWVYRRQNKPAQAQELEEETLRVQRRLLSLEHRDTRRTMDLLVETYIAQGRLTEAQKLVEELLTTRRQLHGAEHQSPLNTMLTLASIYRRQGKPVEAQELRKEVLAVSRRALGEEHPLTLKAKHNLAIRYADLGKPAESQQMLEELLPVMRRVLGPEHPITLLARANLASVYIGSKNKVAEAQQIWEEVLPLQIAVVGPEHEETLLTMYNLAVCYGRQGQLVEAQKLYEESLSGRRRVLGPEHPYTVESMRGLARTLSAQGRSDEAEQVWREIVPIMRRVHGPAHEETRDAIGTSANLQGAKGDWLQALEFFQELITLKPDDHSHWYRAHAAALAAGQTNRCRELSAGMLTRFANSQDSNVWRRVAKSLLLSSDRPSDLETAFALASRAYEPNPNSAGRMVKGIAEYRRAHYAEAEALLEPPPTDATPTLGWYFCAMARHQQGKTTAARTLLEDANRRLAETLRSGDLGDGWHESCRILATRAEAERLILGREVSPPVTADSLALARKQWETVRNLLLEGEALAKQSKWKEGRDAYVRAMDHPAFAWDVAEAGIEGLALKFGVMLARAGDRIVAAGRGWRDQQDHPTHNHRCRRGLSGDEPETIGP
jgi:tetratricopeptide (TPR) repeat protein